LIVLITGGSSGIGKHLAGAYLKRGDQVIIVSDNAAKLEAARVELSAGSTAVSAVTCDVSDPEAVRRMISFVLAEYGCPDVLVNNAGFAVYRSFDQSTMDEVEKLISVNLLGTLRCIHGFLPAMMARRSGHVVNVASIAGLMPVTPCAAYGAAKHAVVGISETLRFELSDFNVKVHLVCPGRVETSFFDHETFRRRPHRPETEKTVPIEDVSRAIIEAVERDRFFTVIPRTLGWSAWVRNLCPPVVDAWLGRLLTERTREARAIHEGNNT
jgi:short-subunit dehydrogenase